jgi:phosphoribosylformylglycinamidine (FGAM) synthase PurS component
MPRKRGVYDIELFVRLKIPDVVAITARTTLQRRMGYGETLKALRREDFWKITVEASSLAAAKRLAVELAEKTSVFVNPNKHAYSFEVRQAGAHDRSKAPTSRDGLWDVRVLVTADDDAEASLTLDTLQNRLGYGDAVRNVERGTLWTLTLAAESADAARGIAEDITVTRRVDAGLLANPHFQGYEIL